MSDSTAQRHIIPASSTPDTPRPGISRAPSRKKVSNACWTCKAAKKKCSGNQPCDYCVNNNVECRFDPSADKRSRPGNKRKIEALEQELDTLSRLVHDLRESDQKNAVALLNLIRSGACIDEIKHFLDERIRNKQLRASPVLEEVLNEVQSLQRSNTRERSRNALDIRRLADNPPFKVPAKPWTRVTEDDSFVSHLISLWLVWYHPFFNWIDRELFLRDMRAADPYAQYCSPFLVNIVLADACAYSDYPEALADPADPFSKGLHFYKEAKEHLDREAGRVTIPTLQGLCVLWATACLLGKDRQGWMYQNQLAFAIKDFTKSMPAKHANNPSRTSQTVVDHMLWGMYNPTTASSMAYQRPSLLAAPAHGRLPTHQGDQNDEWFYYPSPREEPLEGHIACVFNGFCELTTITADVNLLLFTEGEEKPSVSSQPTVEGIYKRLQDWRLSLAPCLDPGEAATPHVLALHMYYHTIIETIAGLSHNVRIPDSSRGQEVMTKRALASAKEVAGLAEKHRMEWSADLAPPANPQWITVAMFTLLGHLEDKENRQNFVQLCVALKAFSRRWPLGQGMLRLIQLTARQKDVRLPSETDALFIDFEQRLWSKKDRERFSSLYPNFFLAATTDGSDDQSGELDKLLEKWDDLSLTGKPD